MAYSGIDVSEFQGDINWSGVKAAGIQFAIIRAGFGSFPQGRKDRKFDQNMKNAEAAGMAVGVYWYSYATTVQLAKQEAENFLSTIRGYRFAYPVYMDFEDDSQRPLTNQQRTQIVETFCSIVEAAGYYTGIYANLYTFQNLLNLSELANYDKWLAQWAATPTYGNEFGGLWQYTSSGLVNGISGRVDMDISYRNYPEIIKQAGLNGYGNNGGSTPDPLPEPPTKYQLHDYVTINGIYTSSDSTEKLKPSITGGTITKILSGHRNPYLLNNGSGWVNDGVIVASDSPTAFHVGEMVTPIRPVSYDGVPLQPDVINKSYPIIQLNGERAVLGAGLNTAFKTNNLKRSQAGVPQVIRVGSTVKIKPGALDYNGTALASFVYDNTYKVIELQGKRAVLSSINTAVNTDNLILVS